MKLLVINKDSLIPFEGNPRRMPHLGDLDRLARLIEIHGFQNPLQVWRDPADPKTTPYIILCGNHRFEAGLLAGLNTFPCIEYRGTREKAIARAISDNKSNEWTTWDNTLLKECLTDIMAIDATEIDYLTGFSMDDIEKFIKEVPVLNDDPAPVRSTQRKRRRRPVTRPGDIWRLGDNKLTCGSIDYSRCNDIIDAWFTRTGIDPVRHDGIRWSALCQNG